MLKLAILTLFLTSPLRASMDQLFFTIATQSLEANIEHLPQGPFLTAGRHHFRSFWTRDFCWASRGLLLTGNDEVVKNQITYLLNHMRKDGLIPKVIDSMNPSKRVLNTTLSKIFPWIPGSAPITADLKTYFVDENKSEAIDSNLMILLTTIAYMKKNNNALWFQQMLSKLVIAYRYYDSYFKEGLIQQPAFSDWQDSVKREGTTFLTNLLYYLVSRQLQEIPQFQIETERLQALQQQIIDTFYDSKSGLFKSIKGHPYISLDGNLLALEQHFLDQKASKTLYQSLAASLFFESLPGQNTYPHYPYSWRSLATKAAFLPYHDRIYWSWLMAFSGKVASLYGDQQKAQLIYQQLRDLILRDGVVHEIYEPKDLNPWKSLAYDSEAPFSWGAAFTIDLIHQLL